jgi:hypothetical protein
MAIGRPPNPIESPGLLPKGYYDDEEFAHFLDNDLRARRALTGALAGGRPVNMRKLINRFGGPTILHQRLVSRGFKVTIKAIEKWRERGRLSSDWLNELFVMAAEEGRPLLLERYIIGFPQELLAGVEHSYRLKKGAPALNKARLEMVQNAGQPVEDSLLG